MHSSKDITYFARVAHRGDSRVFGIRQNDRFYHTYVVGKTGTGKSHLLEIMIGQDVANGRGLAVFDPHGDLITNALSRIPVRRHRDLVYFDATDPQMQIGFNPVANVPAGKQALAAAGMVDVFKKLWPDDWGPRLEHLLRNVAFTLLETAGSTLADIPPLLTDRQFRVATIARLQNEQVRLFWEKEFANYSPAFRAVVVAPLQNKIGALLTDPTLHRIFTRQDNQLDLRDVMDNGRILFVNLDKGKIGEGPASILGSFLVSHIALAGIQRSSHQPSARRDFIAYLDEFQSFATESFVTMLSELRKYRVGLVLAHQFLAQIDPAVRDAVFGNVGTLISFRVGAHDATYLAREFSPVFDPEDLIALPRYNLYVRLTIDGEACRPFSAISLDRAP